ncbi:peptidoglycan-binding protein [Streptomyces sp. KL2]|uniref:peptidoglycan-binding protein n=1 Tax=Streptomyces sp. KL2 TaxID=3050126 RepID=UPI003978AAAB
MTGPVEMGAGEDRDEVLGGPPDTARPRPRRRTWVVGVVGFTAVTVVAGLTGVMTGSGLKSPEQAVADARPPEASLVTTEVERRVIRTSVLLRGKVEPGPSEPVRAPVELPGDPAVVTAAPLRPGARLAEGAVVLEIAGEPVFAVVTDFPMYRDITAGMSGPDVREVQAVLARLGYTVPRGGVFDQATQAAVSRFYRDRGYPVPAWDAPRGGPASGDADGRDGARNGADGGAEAGADGGAAEPPPAATAEPFLPKRHLARIDRPGRAVSAVRVRVGDTVDRPGATILSLDAGRNVVRATVSADQLPGVPVGATAEIADKVSGGRTARATVKSVGDRPGGGETGGGHPVLLKFTGRPLAATPNHTVQISVGGTSAPEKALAVPVTALYARHDGKQYVTVLDGNATADVEVRTGAAGDGWVAVTPVGGSLPAGTRVVVGVAGGTTGERSTP